MFLIFQVICIRWDVLRGANVYIAWDIGHGCALFQKRFEFVNVMTIDVYWDSERKIRWEDTGIDLRFSSKNLNLEKWNPYHWKCICWINDFAYSIFNASTFNLNPNWYVNVCVCVDFGLVKINNAIVRSIFRNGAFFLSMFSLFCVFERFNSLFHAHNLMI